MQAHSKATPQFNGHIDCWLRVMIRTLGDDHISMTMHQIDLHNARVSQTEFEDALNRLCEAPEPLLRKKCLIYLGDTQELSLYEADLEAYLAGNMIADKETGVIYSIRSTAYDLVYEVLPEPQYQRAICREQHLILL